MKADITEPNPIELPMDIAAAVPGMMTIVLTNGDVIFVQCVVQQVRLVLGQKDKDGRRVYNVDWQNGLTVIEAK